MKLINRLKITQLYYILCSPTHWPDWPEGAIWHPVCLWSQTLSYHTGNTCQGTAGHSPVADSNGSHTTPCLPPPPLSRKVCSLNTQSLRINRYLNTQSLRIYRYLNTVTQDIQISQHTVTQDIQISQHTVTQDIQISQHSHSGYTDISTQSLRIYRYLNTQSLRIYRYLNTQSLRIYRYLNTQSLRIYRYLNTQSLRIYRDNSFFFRMTNGSVNGQVQENRLQ